MIQAPIEEVISKIQEKTSLTKDQINGKIEEKLKQLSGLISREGAAHIIANELGIKLFEAGKKLQIKNIMTGMRSVELVARVRNKFPVSEFTTKDGKPGKVGSIILADETGTIRMALWHGQADHMNNLNEGDIVKIVGGYIRENQGRKEIHMNEKAKLIINPEGETVGEIAQRPELERKKIKDLTAGDNAKVLGTVVQVFDPKFFTVCSQCGKKVKEQEGSYVCAQHNQVSPDHSYVLNLFLDDGSSNIRTVFFRDQVEKLTKKTKDDMLRFKDAPENFEDIKTELLGEIVELRGRAVQNTFFDRLEFVVNNVKRDPNPDEEISRLSQQ